MKTGQARRSNPFLPYLFGAAFSAAVVLSSSGYAADVKLWRGQTVYVPIYSYIYYGNKSKKIDLTATLCIRNTDPDQTIEVTSVAYHDSSGRLVRQHLSNPVQLAPLASAHYQVAESDLSGGLGASFVVRWKSGAEACQPLIEGVMIGAISAQGISFVCRGEVIREEAK